jgi:hypothetical protein
MNRISIAQWFSKTIKMPLVASVIAISLIQLAIVAYFGWINNQSRTERLVIMLILANEAATAQHAGTDEPRGAKHELRELQPFNGTGSGFRLERYD